ncbi:MAG TPA: type II toxin-antitoxin system VapC family toxin [Pirellulales bacterium]
MSEPQTPYLVDTNIVVLDVRQGEPANGLASWATLRVPDVHYLSIISVGELLAFSRRLRWGPARLDALDQVISGYQCLDVSDPAVLEAYAEIDDFTTTAGRPMGKNDVWIAATARASGLVLLTADADFDHLHPAWLTRLRIDPATGLRLP